jgi:hypothetical protein
MPLGARRGGERFEAAYADDDSIYESLIHEPSAR